jgi:hypothetical protein
MILCSQRYCHFPPKYLVDPYHDKIQLICGVCLNTRKNWLDGFNYKNEVHSPHEVQISKEQYFEGYTLQFYKLKKDDLKSLNHLEDSQ